VTTKFILTLGATGLLLLHISAVRQASDVAATIVAATNFQTLQWRLVFDAGLAMLVLLTNAIRSPPVATQHCRDPGRHCCGQLFAFEGTALELARGFGVRSTLRWAQLRSR
jgi:hypothetical protein